MTEMPLNLTTIKARAARANDWIRAKASVEATGWVPLSVRVHFGTDVPALLARIAELEGERDGIRASALRDAADALFTMCTDPFDLLTESVGIKGPTAVAVWLTDLANDLDAAKEAERDERRRSPVERSLALVTELAAAERRGYERAVAQIEAQAAQFAASVSALVAECDAIYPVMEAVAPVVNWARGWHPGLALGKLVTAYDAWRAAQPDQAAGCPGATESQDQGADDGAGTEGSQAQEGVQGGECGPEHITVAPWFSGVADNIRVEVSCARCNWSIAYPGSEHLRRRPWSEVAADVAKHIRYANPAPADPAGLEAAIEAATAAIFGLGGKYEAIAGLAVRAAAPHLVRGERAAAPVTGSASEPGGSWSHE